MAEFKEEGLPSHETEKESIPSPDTLASPIGEKDEEEERLRKELERQTTVPAAIDFQKDDPHAHCVYTDIPMPRVFSDASRTNTRSTAVSRQPTTRDQNNKDGPDEGGNDMERTVSNASIAESFTLIHEILFVSIICLAQFMTQAGLTECIFIIPYISESFGITSPGIQSWLVAGYSLTVGTFILVSGRFGDVFGYKRMFIIGFFWFSLWSMIAGVAVYSNLVLFIFARVFQGIGPSIILPNGLAILGGTYPPGKRKALVFAIFGACAPSGSIVGGTFGALFSLAWWPWAWWSLAIALAFIGIACVYVIPSIEHPEMDGIPLKRKFVLLDIPGSLTGVVALILFNFAWNQAPIVGWQEPYIIVTLLLGVVVFTPLFFLIELKWSENPLIPFSVLNSDVAFVLGAVACGWATFGIWFYYGYLFVSNIRHAHPLHVAAWYAPVVVGGISAGLSTAILLPKFGPAVIMPAAMMAFLSATILLATMGPHQIYWAETFVSFLIAPFGMDMSFPAATLMLSNAVDKHHQGIAASLVATVVNYSISLGLGFAGTVEVHVNYGGKTDANLLKGYRGALYLGIGIAALGFGISILNLVRMKLRDRKRGKKESAANAEEGKE